jgi:hypothetical protein
MERGDPRNKMVWTYKRHVGFLEWHLLGCFSKRMFC